MLPVRCGPGERPAWCRFARFLLVVLALLVLAFIVFVRPPGDAVAALNPDSQPAPVPMPAPGSLLDQVLRAHGGVDRWKQVDTLRARVRFGGMAFKLRLIEPESLDRWVEIDVRDPRTVLEDYPQPGQRGIFTPARVWIEGPEGSVLQSLEDPRNVLMDSRRRQLWWDDLDLLYFAGYAIWNYLQGPFLLLRDGVEVQELEPWNENGESWRRLSARFHASVPTHSARQVFYYGPDFLQRRHDYRPDVYAAWAEAAHYSFEYREFDGLQFPTRRRVVPRGSDDRAAAGPALVWIEILELKIVSLE